jgi:hypothetical protein
MNERDGSASSSAEDGGQQGTVSDWDRDYFRRIGEFEAANARDAWAAHEALSLDERLAASWRLSSRSPGRAARAEKYDDPGVIYERAKRLGLYRD